MMKNQNLFYWYQQLIAESLGKEIGFASIISSLQRQSGFMQLYLDGFKIILYFFIS